VLRLGAVRQRSERQGLSVGCLRWLHPVTVYKKVRKAQEQETNMEADALSAFDFSTIDDM
jgi:hypothetical protein